jgi:hypothetical protein
VINNDIQRMTIFKLPGCARPYRVDLAFCVYTKGKTLSEVLEIGAFSNLSLRRNGQ